MRSALWTPRRQLADLRPEGALAQEPCLFRNKLGFSHAHTQLPDNARLVSKTVHTAALEIEEHGWLVATPWIIGDPLQFQLQRDTE